MSTVEKNQPRVPGVETFQLELDQEIIGGLDAYAATLRDTPSRPEIIRRIVRDWLRAHGHMRPAGSRGGTRPEDLNSANDD